ncbi:MAG TPA: carboxypeptidase regulatory-like domain-containing protein [Vicinamibacterales bacterium]|jgi:plastocyanin|nr:carboxypeptidase regulatory-like domain-containing protein [Vicinamibacterales bacterium]
MTRAFRAPAVSACVALAFVISQPPSTGAIEGRVSFEGTPPAPTFVVEGGRTQQVLYVDKSGGLQYAVVYLNVSRGGPTDAPPATLNQRDFIFEPQVLAVSAGQPVRFTSDDPANHNVRSDAKGRNAFSVNTAAGSPAPPPRTFAPTSPDDPVVVSCDIHPWMIAWVYAFERDRFSVTDARGRFRFENVPPGQYRIGVRQPAGRLTRDVAVEVAAGRTATVDVRFTQSDLAVPTR